MNSKKKVIEIGHHEKYKGYEIWPVFNFSNGKSDFDVWLIDSEEVMLFPNTTPEQIKSYIDEIETE